MEPKIVHLIAGAPLKKHCLIISLGTERDEPYSRRGVVILDTDTIEMGYRVATVGITVVDMTWVVHVVVGGQDPTG
jgi:hypothetical protein